MVDPSVEARLGSLEECLDRSSTIESMVALIDAAFGERHDVREPLDTVIAFGLDTSALFRLAVDRANTDSIDYLSGLHTGPLILPGQVVQEYWNNRLVAIETYGASIRKKYEALAAEVAELDPLDPSFHERFQALIDEFSTTYAFAFNPSTATRIRAVLEGLKARASVPYVPRSRFLRIADARHRTRTPPGFRDDKHGDFYVWADFLLGLLIARDDGIAFGRVVLVTQDEKDDWSRGGVAHPLLVAEVRALTGASFETWNLARLREYVAASPA